MNLNQKNIGFLLIGFAIVLILILAFVKVNTDERGAFLCQAVSESPDLDMSECPAHKDSTSWLIIAAFGIVFLIFGFGVYLGFMPLKKEELDFKKIDLSKLETEERKIYDLLKQNQGSMYQSDIIKETGLSKVHISRILDKMEGKNVLERKRRGMTNIIILK